MINKKEKKQEQQKVKEQPEFKGYIVEFVVIFLAAVLFMSILSYAFLNLFIK